MCVALFLLNREWLRSGVVRVGLSMVMAMLRVTLNIDHPG